MTTITLTGLVRNSSNDFTLASGNSSPGGMCHWNGRFRNADLDDTIYAYADGSGSDAIGTEISSENIILPTSSINLEGLTTDGTNLIVLYRDKKIRIITPDGTIGDLITLVKPVGISNLDDVPSSIAWDENNSVLLVGWRGIGTNPGYIQSNSLTGSLTSHVGFSLDSANDDPTGMRWYAGYVITVDVFASRFFVYNTDGTYLSGINPSGLSGNVNGIAFFNNGIYVASDTTTDVKAFTVSTTISVPDAPEGLDGTENTDGEVALTWDDPSDDTITDYAIFRKVGNGTYTELTTTALITGQAYTDDTAVAGTGYTYKIQAVNDTGNSADSNEFPFTTAVADTTAPRPETGVPASADVTTDEVSWRVTFSEDVQNVDRTDFGIKRVGVANFDPHTVTQISASVYDVFGTLPVEDVYHLRLRGTSDITDLSGNLRSGTGEISGSTITYTASTIDPPDAPTGLALTEDNPTEVTVTWDVSTDETITDYNIYRGEVFGGPYTLLVDIVFDVTTDEGSYVDDTAEVDTTYYYVIRAENDGGESDNSTEVGITTDEEVTEDTTAPTFTIDGNDDDFDTTLELGHTYTEFEFRNKVDVDTSLDDDITYKNSSGAVITSFDGIAPSEGSYTIEYTLTDDADNSTTIVESLTVEDTTNPTFEVDDNTAAFATTVAYNGTYTVKAITDIVDASTTVSTITGNTAVDTSTAGDYLVTYTITDESANANSTSIVETVTVSAEVVTTNNELTGFTRTSDEDISLPSDNANLNGWCWWNGYWRSLDSTDSIIYAIDVDGNHVPTENITLPAATVAYSGLTKNATDLVVLSGGGSGRGIRTITTSGTISDLVSFPLITVADVGTSATSIAYDVTNDQYWITWIGDTGFGTWLQPYSSSFAEISGGFRAPSAARRITGMSWENGYLICVGLDETRFRVFDLDDNSEVAVTTDALHADGRGLGVKDGIAFVAYRDNAVDAWTINYAEAADTTAPTFTIESNGSDYTADFATTIVFEESYTVGVISDISETGTTSVISGNDDVDTSVAGEYTVTYTVTDAANNSTEIIETVTVSAEILPVPDTPTGLAGTQTYEEVTLTWNNPNDNTITGYKIYRDNAVLVNDTGSTTREYVDDTVEADTEYVYKIAAINNQGTSDDSSIITITTDSVPDVTAPTFQVDDNTTDYATTVAFEGTYTVGVISDISETGTTSTITGDSNVNTSTAGEYTVTYTVTDAAGNAGEIVETVTVSPEVIVPDTTAPTFTVKTYSADFDITIELGAVYNVGTFDDIVDEDASPSEDIVYKNSSGNTITSFDGDELAIGTYSVEYTLTDDAGNVSITIIESITVEDTTAPTFVVKTRSADFNTAVTNGNTYTVGTIGSIVDESTYSTNIDGDDDVNTSTDGEYTVTYTVTDASSNVGTIVETVTVSSTPDTTAPTITSATPDDATLVNSIDAEWLVTFSEDVQDVGVDDFFIKKDGISNFSPVDVTTVSASQYRVFAELPSAGVYHLRIRGSSDISDLSDNEITQSGQISNSTITYTDTIAPTFTVRGYVDDFITNVITGGTYTVGTIDNIVEVNVYNELISGASSVDTSTEGDYEVEYSVTDVNNNEKMIIETVTVADAIVTVAGTLDFTFKYEIQKTTTTIANPNPMIVSSDKAVVK